MTDSNSGMASILLALPFLSVVNYRPERQAALKWVNVVCADGFLSNTVYIVMCISQI